MSWEKNMCRLYWINGWCEAAEAAVQLVDS